MKNLEEERGDEVVDIPPALQLAWVGELRKFFDMYNHTYLKSCLRPPLIRLGYSRQRLGEWDAGRRSITISVHHILGHPWESVLETLRHEMAHQYVHETLGMPAARPHGDAFTRACRLLRCDKSARASNAGLGTDAAVAERQTMLRRVRELLALAGSPNEHEAASAMRMANKYLLKYNLRLTEADAAREYQTRQLGKCSGRVQEYEYALGNLLQEHFFVLVIWTTSYDPRRDRRGRMLEIVGTPENLEIAAYVYDYVMWIADRLWREYRTRHGREGGTRFQYLAGLLRGLADKLSIQSRTLAEEHGIVWTGDPELQEFFRHLHPRVISSSTCGVARSASFRAGMKDGRDITLRRGIGGNARHRGRLLDG